MEPDAEQAENALSRPGSLSEFRQLPRRSGSGRQLPPSCRGSRSCRAWPGSSADGRNKTGHYPLPALSAVFCFYTATAPIMKGRAWAPRRHAQTEFHSDDRQTDRQTDRRLENFRRRPAVAPTPMSCSARTLAPQRWPNSMLSNPKIGGRTAR